MAHGAGNEGRTRDIQLGRLTLYQLSYSRISIWWRGQDLNLRPSGYEPDELPDCSTPRYVYINRWCLGRESNPHDPRGHRILSPVRLPVPPPRRCSCPLEDRINNITEQTLCQQVFSFFFKKINLFFQNIIHSFILKALRDTALLFKIHFLLSHTKNTILKNILFPVKV